MKMPRVWTLLVTTAFGFAAGWLGHAMCHHRPQPWEHHGWHDAPGEMPPPDGPDGDRGPGGHGPLDHMLDDAQVSAEQKTKILAIDDQHRPVLDSLRKEVEQKRQAFEEAQQKDGPESDVRTAFIVLQDAKRARETAFFEMFREIRQILTPQQRQRLDELRKSHHRGPHAPD